MQTIEGKPFPPFPPQHTEPPGLESELNPRPQFEAPEYKPAGKLEGKVALISGGDSGIGRAVGHLFAREGANVAFTHLREEHPDAQDTLHAIQSLGREALALEVDIKDQAACEQAVSETVARFGKLDILVNNAAFQRHVKGFEELDPSQWQRTLRTNLDGYFFLTKAALPHLPRGGIIINTGSITGLEGSRGLIDYSASKGAIHAFTKALAQDLVRREIRVNCVAPGPVWTPLNPAERDTSEIESFGAKTPYGRPAQPEEVAPAYVFFACSDSSYISGEVLTMLGGATRAG